MAYAARFNDPLAGRTAWTANDRGGSTVVTHRLVRATTTRMEFRVSLLMYAVSILPLPAGLLIIVGGVLPVVTGDRGMGFTVPLKVLVGIGTMLLGVFLLKYVARPRVFDTRLGWSWLGRRMPAIPAHNAPGTTMVALARVRAVQVVGERCHDRVDYISYEINLVLDDGTRITTLDHRHLGRVRADATALAAFLVVPLWDAADCVQ